MYYSAFGKFLTLTLEARVVDIAYQAYCTTLSIVQSHPSGSFQRFDF